MSSLLSATAPIFTLAPLSTSRNATDLVAQIEFRDNNDIGTYENGVLVPRAGVTSVISWKEACASAAETSAGIDEMAATGPVTRRVETGMIAMSQPEIICDPHNFQHVEHLTSDLSLLDAANTYRYQTSPFQVQDMPGPRSIEPSLFLPAHFRPHTYAVQPALALPYDVAVSDTGRPTWNPVYHKSISPGIERANRVVEEFKVYFGDGRSPEILIQLQKICFLCSFGEAQDLPQTIGGCLAMLRNIYINVFDLVEAGRADEQGWGLFIPTFRPSKAFFNYSKEEGKLCPRWIGKANPLFQAVMRRFR